MRPRGACQRRNRNKNTRKFARKSIVIGIKASELSKSMSVLGKAMVTSSNAFREALSACADRVRQENKLSLARMSLIYKCTERPKGSV